MHILRKVAGKITRRGFLKASGLAGLPLLAGLVKPSTAMAQAPEQQIACSDLNAHRGSYWKEQGKYFVQPSVDLSYLNQGVIRAKIDGKWRSFLCRNVDEHFFLYNIQMRLRMIKVMMGLEELQIYNDAHNAAVASYGANRGDSMLTVNCAYKGMGWIPTPEMIDEMTQEYYDNYKSSMMKKIQIIQNNYKDKTRWRRDVIGSLELYTAKEFETHTFLNMMENPAVSICFLGDESYEVRAICRLVHPKDPSISEDEYKIVKWINYAHDFFHGGPQGNLQVYRIAAIYYVIEVFDNSPAGATQSAGGLRLVPSL